MLTFEIYKSGFIRPSWKWRARHSNGKIMASGRGFNTKYLCKESVDQVINYCQMKQYNIKINGD